MNPTITNTINAWKKASGEYSYETRSNYNINAPQKVSMGSIIPMNFSIDVKGFFEDAALTKPITLYFQDVLTIDDQDMTQTYANQFTARLNQFTANAYNYFKNHLSTFPQPTYTSDLLHM